MTEYAESEILTIAQKLAAWSYALRLEEVPEEVVHVAKRCLVDTVGVTIAGARHPLATDLLDYAAQHHTQGSSSVLGFEDRLSPVGAALVNGAAGHVLDFDDTSYTGIMHGSVVALPAALAATEYCSGDGRRLIEAFIAGSEVTYAVALLCTSSHYFKGWWSTATFGAFGAAAAAAKAMGLSEEQTCSAIALAGTQANGQKVAFGTDAKPYLSGKTAAIGVESALLAARGLVGPAAVLEGSRGFVELLNDGISDPKGIDDLGKIWRLQEPGIMFKQFPVCSAAHAAVELTQNLMNENDIAGADVAAINCDVTPVVAISLVHDRPRTVQEAQFSLPFALGSILVDGELGIENLTQEALTNPRMREAMTKIEMHRVDALQTEEAPEGARVTIETKDGHAVTAYLAQPTGMPGNPMSDQRLYVKFRRCLKAGGVPEQQAEELLQHLLSIETAATPLGTFARQSEAA